MNANPLFLNKEFKGIRSYGGINELNRISAEDDRVSTVAVLKPEDMTKKQKKEMSLQAEKLNMEIGFIEKNTYIIKDND